MQEEFYDHYYQAGRADLHAGLDRGFHAIGRFVGGTFDAIHNVQFAAPWKRPVGARDRAGLA